MENTNLNLNEEVLDAAEEIVLDDVSNVSLVKGGLIAVGAAVVVGGVVFLTTKYAVPAVKKLFKKDKDDESNNTEVKAEETESK